MAIDVGASCSDRASQISSGSTYVSIDNPANATGTIDEVQVYAQSNMSGIEFASFSADANDLTTNGDTNGSNLSATAGSCTTFNAPGDFTAFDINSGEYIGIYFSGGLIEGDYVGGSGYWWQSGDKIPCTAEEFWVQGGRVVSLYATGSEGVTALEINVSECVNALESLV